MILLNKKMKLRTVAKSDTTCEVAISMVGNYLTGSMAPRVRDEFEQHLSLCPDCAAFLKTYKKTIEVTRAFLRSHAPNPVPHRMSLRDKHVRSLMSFTFWLHLFLSNLSLIVG
jgi:anti-sigma factor RsiW